MFKPISIFPALALAALALFVAGCGGSGDESPTREAYLKQAEAICKKIENTEAQEQGKYIQENLAQLKREPPPPNNKGTFVIVETIRVPYLYKQVEELEALDPPEGDEAQLQRIFEETKKGAKELGEEPKLIWATRARNPLYPSWKLSNGYGFRYCAEA